MSDTSVFDAQLHEAKMTTAIQMQEAFYIYKPRLFIDGDQWCALYGDNLQDGVAGFGKSPDDARWAFNKAWDAELPCCDSPGKEKCD